MKKPLECVASGYGNCETALVAMGNEHHQQQKNHRDERQRKVIEKLAGKSGFTLLPVAQFSAVFDAHLVQMFEVPFEFVRRGVPIFGVPFQRAIQDFLQLGGDRRVSDAGGMGLFSRRSFITAMGEGPKTAAYR